VLSDPLAVTYNGSAKSLPRTSANSYRTVYRTADGEFEVQISNSPTSGNGLITRSIELSRILPDPTPSNVFDDFRRIANVFGLSYRFEPHRPETSVDLPRLRTALLALCDSSFEARIVGGEK
jgi:hypothetical protein